MRQCHHRLRADRVLKRLRDDVGIAVAIATNPRAHDEERRHRGVRAAFLRAARLDSGVEPRDLVEERLTIVGDAVVDFVLHFELREPQHRRLPQREHLPVETVVHRLPLVGRELAAVAPLQQADDLALAVEDALALYLGRVRGEHRAHQGIGEERADRLRTYSGVAQAIERVRDAARLRRRPGDCVRPPPAVLMHILGQIGEVREVAEGAHHVKHLRDRQRVEEARQLVLDVRGSVARRGAAQVNGRLPDRLDTRETFLAGLSAKHVAENPAEQTSVFLEREILVSRRVHANQF